MQDNGLGNQSVWSAQTDIPERPPLDGDRSVHTAVIGAGMAGMLTAYLLQRQGIDVLVLEADRIGQGVTKNTTAKITSQHGLFYDRLITDFGERKARQYADLNQRAIEQYAAIIQREKIDCDFMRIDAGVYSRDNRTKLIREVKAAQQLGLPATLADSADLPFSVKGVVRFSNQAQFQPLEFLAKISEQVEVCEQTPVREVEGNRILTGRGTVTADHIVVATHYPFINTPGYYFLRMHQQRSYVLALKGAPLPDGMYIDAEDGGYTFRPYGEYLLFGGEGHRSGKNPDGGQYAALEKAAKAFYPDAEVAFRWSAQDCMTLDHVPYIGEYAADTQGLYVATGFNKWGMTGSMVAAMLLSAEIAEKSKSTVKAETAVEQAADRPEDEREREGEIFSPHRFNLTASALNIVKNGAETVSGFAKRASLFPPETTEAIAPGQAQVIEYHGESLGVYKDREGTPHFVSADCAHLGCRLEWNPEELTWDCPCHGSRFDIDGRVVDSPAVRGIGDD